MRLLIFALALVLGAGPAHADATIPTQDEDGSRDHPLLKRYEGSYIVSQDEKSFTEFELPLSKLEEVAGKKAGHPLFEREYSAVGFQTRRSCGRCGPYPPRCRGSRW